MTAEELPGSVLGSCTAGGGRPAAEMGYHATEGAEEAMEIHPAVTRFGEWMSSEYRADGKYEQVLLLSGPDAAHADLSVRLDVGKRSYYEARVLLEAGELQAGFATESRNINESIEQMILDNGGDLDDLLADELCDLGKEPLPMAHFFERPAFRFIVRLPLPGPDLLDDAALRARVKAIIRAGCTLFQACVDEA
jgi:hypothetical protein